MKESTSTVRFRLLVLFFYLSLCCLLGSGRLASLDAGAQLQATVLLLGTGSLGTLHPPENGLWIRNPDGVFYECHDIGNVGLMLPGALAGKIVTPTGNGSDDFANPSVVSRVGVSFTCSILSAVGCYYMFRLLALYYVPLQAFYLSSAFLIATPFLAYSRAAWDVLGACCFSCITIYHLGAVASGGRVGRHIIPAAITLAAACSFRLSTAPFLFAGFILSLWFAIGPDRGRFRWLLVSCVMLFLGLLPNLAYNFVRTGNPFLPGTAVAQYIDAGTADLSGNVFAGLYGLLFSPNKGLLCFSPLFAVLAALPFYWRSIPKPTARWVFPTTIGVLLYIVFLGKIRSWGDVRVGATVFDTCYPTLVCPRLPACGATLGSLSFGIDRPLHPFRVHQSSDRNDELELGVSGASPCFRSFRKLALSASGGLERIRSRHPIRIAGTRFPDLWTFYLMRQSGGGLALGPFLVLFVATIGLLILIVRSTPNTPPREIEIS
jgi:hypothetical protein